MTNVIQIKGHKRAQMRADLRGAKRARKVLGKFIGTMKDVRDGLDVVLADEQARVDLLDSLIKSLEIAINGKEET